MASESKRMEKIFYYRVMRVLVLLLIFLMPAPAFSWQQVAVEELFEDGLNKSEIRDRAMRSGFRQAVSQEVDRIISGLISRQRSQALMEHLSGQVAGLVLGYRQVSWTEEDQTMVLEMEVNVDDQSLRSLLQEAGVYYTSISLLPYDLNTRGASPEDFSRLQELQLVTGTVVDGSAETRLSLSKSADGMWSGDIVHGDISTSAAGRDLDRVWYDLWAYYFSRPEIRSLFMGQMVLVTSGWSTTDSIMIFDDILGAWDREVEYRSILSVESDSYALGASWIIRSLSPDLLQEHLESYFGPRDIDYQVKLH